MQCMIGLSGRSTGLHNLRPAQYCPQMVHAGSHGLGILKSHQFFLLKMILGISV